MTIASEHPRFRRKSIIDDSPSIVCAAGET
jgi:hypothetical protein